MPTDSGGVRRAKLAAARLYLICDAQQSAQQLEALLRAAIAGGVDVVQLREKRLRDQELADAASRAARVCHEMGTLFVVNDDPHTALAAGADGAHLGQHDMPAPDARELVGPDVLLGLSTHTPAQVDDAAGPRRARTEVVDYIGVGPVFETPTKPGRQAVGVELVRHAAGASDLPFFAIGGITAGNVREVLQAGARRVAVVRAIAGARHPEDAARALRAELEQVAFEHAHRAAAA